MSMRRLAVFAKITDARVEREAFISGKNLVDLRWHSEEAVVFLGFPMSLKEKKP